MTITVGIRRHDIVQFPDGEFRFDRELPGNLLLFNKTDTSCDFTIAEEELARLWSEGRAWRKVSRVTEATGRLAALPASALLPPDLSREARTRAETTHFYVCAYDDHPVPVSKGRKGVERFLRELRPMARARGFTHDLKYAAFISACRKGVSGHRPVGYFVDQRGKVPRQPKHPERAELMRRTVDYYWSKRTRDFSDAFAFFRVELRAINELRKSRKQDLIPEPRRMESVRTAIRNAECHERWRTKYSKREADQQFRGTAEAMSAEAIGELIIIDHTTLDTFLLLDADSGIPLGRVTLTLAIDVKSRAIVGFLISPEPPSIYSVTSIIKIINRSKRPYDEKYPDVGYEYAKYYIKGDTYLLDNGVDFASPAVLQSLTDVGVEVIYAPIGTPEFKAPGERIFHTFNTLAIHKTNGAVLGTAEDRRRTKDDPSKQACITLAECEELMYRAVAQYHRDEHSTLQTTPEKAWQAGLARGEHKLIDDVNVLDHLIGNETTVTISRRGIKFKNCRFHDSEATSYILNAMYRHTAIKPRAKKGEGGANAKVKIKWDPGDCSRISVFVTGDVNNYVSLPNIHKKYGIGCSFWHHQQVFEFAQKANRPFDSEFEALKRRHELRQLMEAQTTIVKGRRGKRLARALAAVPPDNAEMPIHENTFDEGVSTPVEPFSNIRTDAQTRPPGARPGQKKAARTKKINDLARMRIAELERSDQQLDPGDQTPHSIDFLKLAGWKQ